MLSTMCVFRQSRSAVAPVVLRGQVRLTDALTVYAAREFLQFLYTGVLTTSRWTAVPLLLAAHVYGIMSLQVCGTAVTWLGCAPVYAASVHLWSGSAGAVTP